MEKRKKFLVGEIVVETEAWREEKKEKRKKKMKKRGIKNEEVENDTGENEKRRVIRK